MVPLIAARTYHSNSPGNHQPKEIPRDGEYQPGGCHQQSPDDQHAPPANAIRSRG